MIRALLKAAAVAAVSSYAYKAYKSGKLDSTLSRFGFKRPPSLDSAYSGANASKPAPAHPWPVDPQALGKGDGAAAHPA